MFLYLFSLVGFYLWYSLVRVKVRKEERGVQTVATFTDFDTTTIQHTYVHKAVQADRSGKLRQLEPPTVRSENNSTPEPEIFDSSNTANRQFEPITDTISQLPFKDLLCGISASTSKSKFITEYESDSSDEEFVVDVDPMPLHVLQHHNKLIKTDLSSLPSEAQAERLNTVWPHTADYIPLESRSTQDLVSSIFRSQQFIHTPTSISRVTHPPTFELESKKGYGGGTFTVLSKTPQGHFQAQTLWVVNHQRQLQRVTGNFRKGTGLLFMTHANEARFQGTLDQLDIAHL